MENHKLNMSVFAQICDCTFMTLADSWLLLGDDFCAKGDVIEDDL